MALRVPPGQHKKIAQGLEQGSDVGHVVRRRVVNAQVTGQRPVHFHGSGHQAVDGLAVQEFIFHRIGFL